MLNTALATGQCLRPCPPRQCWAWAPAPPQGARLVALGGPTLPGGNTGPRGPAPPPRVLVSAALQVAYPVARPHRLWPCRWCAGPAIWPTSSASTTRPPTSPPPPARTMRLPRALSPSRSADAPCRAPHAHAQCMCMCMCMLHAHVAHAHAHAHATCTCHMHMLHMLHAHAHEHVHAHVTCAPREVSRDASRDVTLEYLTLECDAPCCPRHPVTHRAARPSWRAPLYRTP